MKTEMPNFKPAYQVMRPVELKQTTTEFEPWLDATWDSIKINTNIGEVATRSMLVAMWESIYPFGGGTWWFLFIKAADKYGCVFAVAYSQSYPQVLMRSRYDDWKEWYEITPTVRQMGDQRLPGPEIMMDGAGGVISVLDLAALLSLERGWAA